MKTRLFRPCFGSLLPRFWGESLVFHLDGELEFVPWSFEWISFRIDGAGS